MEGGDANCNNSMASQIGGCFNVRKIPLLSQNLHKETVTRLNGLTGQVKSQDIKVQLKANQAQEQKFSEALSAALKSEPNRIKSVSCANTKCLKSTKNAFPVPPYASACLGVEKLPSGAMLCDSCFEKAKELHQKSKKLLTTNENLFSLKFPPPTTTSNNDLVDLVSDDESDLETEETPEAKEEGEVYSISSNLIATFVGKVMERVDIHAQLRNCEKTVENEVDDLTSQFSKMDIEMEQLKSKIDSLNGIYNDQFAEKIHVVEVGSIEIDRRGKLTVTKAENPIEKLGLTAASKEILKKALEDLETVEKQKQPEENEPEEVESDEVLPLPQELIKPVNRGPLATVMVFVKPLEGQWVYAMDKNFLSRWLLAKISQVSPSTPVHPTTYMLKFPSKFKSRRRSCIEAPRTGKQIAFRKACARTLFVGARVIARFRGELKTDVEFDGYFFAGVVAEGPSTLNTFRYLIFFDDGYAQYVQPTLVFPVVEPSRNVWEDVPKKSQEFIRDYITKYPERHMLRTSLGVEFPVKLKKLWPRAKVVAVDGSLVKVKFPKKSPLEFEWIYRGSTRLWPLCSRLESLEAKSSVARRHTGKSNFGFEVNRNVEDKESRASKSSKRHPGAGKKEEIFDLPESQGKISKVEIPHGYNSEQYEAEDFRNVSPLAVPFYFRWKREISDPSRKTVLYFTPSGIKCESYQEIHSYLTSPEAVNIPIDCFSLEFDVDCLNVFQPSTVIQSITDISGGKEKTPISCVNSLDDDLPVGVDYVADRLLGAGVNISDEDGFLVCCDCKDDCQDKKKCACFQQTLAGVGKSSKLTEIGYENRRLGNRVLNGIYECNQNCKCRSTCFNRVVQNNVQWPLQLFKTAKKGWGVRPLHDMPRGTFVCTYSGVLLSEEMANQVGKEAGDEYLAELDLIEMSEHHKEGYESEVTDIEMEETGTATTARNARKKRKIKHTRRKSIGIGRGKSFGGKSLTSSRKSGSNCKKKKKVIRNTLNPKIRKDDGDEEDDSYSNFFVSEEAKNQPNAPRSLRKYFGDSESDVYIVDAKSKGNIGRYLNHSCVPNVFVQNVFVENHDPRFHLVAFFTIEDVKAGTELCWDYNYVVGSASERTMYCYCLQKGCRKRLL